MPPPFVKQIFSGWSLPPCKCLPPLLSGYSLAKVSPCANTSPLCFKWIFSGWSLPFTGHRFSLDLGLGRCRLHQQHACIRLSETPCLSPCLCLCLLLFCLCLCLCLSSHLSKSPCLSLLVTAPPECGIGSINSVDGWWRDQFLGSRV